LCREEDGGFIAKSNKSNREGEAKHELPFPLSSSSTFSTYSTLRFKNFERSNVKNKEETDGVEYLFWVFIKIVAV
jgi:hypothetical protein